jgi:uncharacterized protein YggU (UPF0235/DUF167 family)
MRVAIHVRPGARAVGVGGLHGDALVVRVRDRAVDGNATKAALAAVASALEVPQRDVVLVAGATTRVKIVDIPDTAAARLATLRDAQRSS